MTLPPTSPSTPPSPAVPPGTPVHTGWGWVTAWIPVTSLVLTVAMMWMMSAAMLDWFRRIAVMVVAQRADPSSLDPSLYSGMIGTVMPFTVASIAFGLLGWGLYALGVVAAHFDYAELGRLGYPRRFHWAWSFLNPVYPIGRAVVVHRQAGAGWATMWLAVGATIATVLLSLIWSFWLVFAALNEFSVLYGTMA